MAVNRIAIFVKTRHFTLLAAEPYKPELNPGERRCLVDRCDRAYRSMQLAARGTPSLRSISPPWKVHGGYSLGVGVLPKLRSSKLQFTRRVTLRDS
jgi:hypothetical protein